MSDFLIITNEIPEGGFTRAQLLHMIKTAKLAAASVDGATIEINASDKLAVKELPQSKVTGLVVALEGKQTQAPILDAIRNLTTNGLIARSAAGQVEIKVIGTHVQAWNELLNAITTISSNGLIERTASDQVEIRQIGTHIQAFSAFLTALAAAGQQSGIVSIDPETPSTISDPPTQTEVQEIKAVVDELRTQFNALVAALKTQGLIAD